MYEHQHWKHTVRMHFMQDLTSLKPPRASQMADFQLLDILGVASIVFLRSGFSQVVNLTKQIAQGRQAVLRVVCLRTLVTTTGSGD